MFIKKKRPFSVSGLPATDWQPSNCFTQILKSASPVFTPFTLLQNYSLWKVYQTGNAFCGNVSLVKTVLVSDLDDKPLFYAYVIEDGDNYIMAQIGFRQIYKVAKKNVHLEETKVYRLMFCPLKNDNDAIAVFTTGKRRKMVDLLIRSSTGAEHHLNYRGHSEKGAIKWLEKHGLF